MSGESDENGAMATAPARVSWRRFLAPYYGLNLVVLLSYVVIRQYRSSAVLDQLEGLLNIPREQEIFLLVAMMFAMNYRKGPTVDAVVATFLLYTKLGVLVALYYLDKRLFGWMLVYCTVLFIAVGQPKYTGPQNVTMLDVLTWPQHIGRSGGSAGESVHTTASSRTKTKAKPKESPVSWLVFFSADWSDHCLQHDPMFADLSLRYGSETLRFGKVDVEQSPQLAQEFQIEVSTMSWQLPTLVLFQDGVEVDRLPRIKEDGRVAKVILDSPGVAAVFQLAERSEGKKVQ